MKETKVDITETREILKMTQRFYESRLKELIDRFTKRLERLSKDINNIANNESDKLYEKPYKMIHEINWTIANMDFSGITESAGDYKGITQELERFNNIFKEED